MGRSNSLDRRMTVRRVGAALAVVLFASCAPREEPPEPEGPAIDKSLKRGPITVALRVDKDEITIAETVELVIEARVEEGYEVEMPKFGEKLEQFGIVEFREPPPTLAADGRVTVSRTYILEPFLSGDYVIPPMKIRFWKPEEAEEDRHEIETEEISVKVASLLPEDLAELAIKDIAAPVALPNTSRAAWYAVAALVLAVAGVVAAWALWRRRKRRVESVEVIPPHELAFRALEAVLAEQLIEKGEFKQFYIRVSDILRRFLENRFALHAPERTTEEFLAELGASDVLESAHKALLHDFLGHCDLVKFAEHEPSNDDIQRTFDTCKQFVLDTEPSGVGPEQGSE